MTNGEDRDLLHRLAGESAPADRAALWAALEPPPVEPAPPDFAGRVMSRVGEEVDRRRSGVGRLWAVPGRLAAASALSAGLVAGAGLGVLVTPAERELGRAATGSAVASAGAADAAHRLSGAIETAWLAEDELLALAVEAAGGDRPADDPATSLALDFGADPELAGGYLAALDGLEGEPQ